MKTFIQNLRWNAGKLILQLGYFTRGEIPRKNWFKKKKEPKIDYRINFKGVNYEKEHPLDAGTPSSTEKERQAESLVEMVRQSEEMGLYEDKFGNPRAKVHGKNQHKAKLIQPSDAHIIGAPSDSEVMDPYQTEAEKMLERILKVNWGPVNPAINTVHQAELFTLILQELIRLEKKTDIE